MRLWPMSRRAQPKQLIPLSNGRSPLQLALARLEGLVPTAGLYICSSREHRQQILEALDRFPEDQYIGEPIGRDTLAAVGVSAAVISRSDPDAAMAVFTADQLIEPVDAFQRTVASGYELVERHPDALVTFGIEPDSASTGYGYLELAQPWEGDAYSLKRFQEKPDRTTAQRFFKAGPAQFLWNSGMFVWRVSTILECIRRYAPDTFARINRIAEAWDTAERDAVFDLSNRDSHGAEPESLFHHSILLRQRKALIHTKRVRHVRCSGAGLAAANRQPELPFRHHHFAGFGHHAEVARLQFELHLL